MINIDTKEMRVAFKIIGIFCFLVAGLIYGEIKFINGRQLQCYEDGGFLIKGEDGEPYCKPGEILRSEGWVIDNYNTLSRTDPVIIFNNSNINFNYSFG